MGVCVGWGGGGGGGDLDRHICVDEQFVSPSTYDDAPPRLAGCVVGARQAGVCQGGLEGLLVSFQLADQILLFPHFGSV